MRSATNAGKTQWLPGPVTLFLVWTALGCLSYTRHYLQAVQADPHAAFWPDLFAWLDCFDAWAVLTPLVFRLERRFPLERASWLRNLPVVAAAGFGIGYAAYLLSDVLTMGLRQLQHRPTTAFSWGIPAAEVYIEQFIFWSVFVVGYGIRNRAELHQKQREIAEFALEKAQLETTLREAELEALRMRLNPHFLFNSLQNISVLAQQDPRTASRMLTRLGDLLRAAFRREFAPETPLENEIALTRAYVDIEKMRFGDRLRVDIDIAPGTERARVPALLLQPLVENAIIHGLADVSHDGRIRIQSDVHDGQLVLSVRDNGAGVPSESVGKLEMGVGLGATRDRLARMYPERHELTLRRLNEGGTEVRVVVPLSVA